MKEILNLALVFFLSSYWLIVPIVFLVVMLFLLGTRKTNNGRWIIAVVSLIGVVLMAWYGFGRVAYYDWQVKRLCAIDGGVKVYETVELPTEMFDKWGMVKFYQPVQKENALGSDYVLKRKVTFFREKKPTIERIHYLILRRSGGKALGETVLYTRGGGDLPGLWEGSSYACPAYKDAGINQLIKSVFHKTKGVYQ